MGQQKEKTDEFKGVNGNLPSKGNRFTGQGKEICGDRVSHGGPTQPHPQVRDQNALWGGALEVREKKMAREFQKGKNGLLIEARCKGQNKDPAAGKCTKKMKTAYTK